MTQQTTDKEFRVILIGCGGIGTWLASGLAKALQFHRPKSVLMMIDGDTFEPKNAERQQFTHIGNKAFVLRDDLQPLHPNVFCIPQAAWIVSDDVANSAAQNDEEDDGGLVIAKLSANEVLAENDIVFVCVDNYAARKLVFDAAKNFDNIDILTGGNDDGLEGHAYHYRRRDGRDVTNHPGYYHDEFVNPPDKNPGELSCQERAMIEGGTQLLAINMSVASLLLAKFAHLFLGTPEQIEAAIEKAEVFFDLGLCLSAPYDRRTVSQPQQAALAATAQQ